MSAKDPKLLWTVVGVVPVSGRGLLYCYGSESPFIGLYFKYGHVGTGGTREFAKWIRKTQKKGKVLLCWDAPLTSAEFQRRGIERLGKQWVKERFAENQSKPAIRSAGMRPHWITTQRLLGMPVHEGMAIRGSQLQPKLICENVLPTGSVRDLHVTEVHPSLAIALHPSGPSLPWYRDHLENAWSYYKQAARLWNLGEQDLPLPQPRANFRMQDFIEAWVAMALGILWLNGGGVELVGTRRDGSWLLPTKMKVSGMAGRDVVSD